MKFIKPLVLVIALSAIYHLAISQTEKIIPCHFDEYYEQQFKENPSMREALEEHLAIRNVDAYAVDRREALRIIPVVVHVIHMGGSENVSEASINAMLQRANEDWQRKNPDTTSVRSAFKGVMANMNVEFRLAKIDPNGKCTDGIIRIYSDKTENAGDNVKNLSRWNNQKYLNIWIVKSIDNGGQSGIILGYSAFPIYSMSQAARDGIVLRSDVVNYSSRTFTHELGHFLGLYHTFQDGCGSSDCKKSGDLICDTPPVLEDTYNCNQSKNSCSNDYPDLPDMNENHMDYTTCRVMFTKGQKAVVDYYIASSYRNSLFTYNNLVASGTYDPQNVTCKPVAGISIDNETYCVGDVIQLADNSTFSGTPTYKWYFTNGTPSVSTLANPSVVFGSAGFKDIKLVIKTAGQSDSVTVSKAVLVYPSTGNTVSYKEDFESLNFDNEYFYVDPIVNNIGWRVTNLSAYEGDKCFYVNNFNLATTNKEYSFIFPPINLVGITAPKLYYIYAHAKIDGNSKDMLRIYASTNCGKSWSLRKTVSYANLPTTPSYFTKAWIPSDITYWKEDGLDLSNYTGSKNVLLKFSFVGYGGNNFYIDNMKIYSATGIEDNGNNSNIRLYPNPAQDKITIDFLSVNASVANVTVTDLAGKIIINKNLNIEQGENRFELGLENIVTSGFYIFNLRSDEGVYQYKFSVIK